MHGTSFIGETLAFYLHTARYDTNAAADATGDPAYRIYEATTDTPILTGSFAKLDDSNTTGLYAASIAVTTANGFEHGKSYVIYATATVNAVAQNYIVSRFRVDNGFALKWLKNKTTFNTNTKVYTLYDDDGSTSLATRTESESGSTVTFPALA